MPKDEEAKASPIGNFLSKLGRVRARSPKKPSLKNSTDKENNVVFKCPAPPRSHSPSSKFGTLVNRLSGRKPKTISCRESSLDRAETPKNPPQHVPFQSPRPAVSENDLRHVTLSRGSTDLPVTPLAGVTHFMSEDNLASSDCGTPAHRVPSYVKISCTLNGYSKSPRQHAQIFDSPLRSTKGMSLVERRLMQYRDFSNSACNTPSPKRLPIYNDETSPEMGNNISSTTPIKSLISQFDKLHLCSQQKDSEKENDRKSEKVISIQPESDEGLSDKENISNLSKYIGEPIPSTSSSELGSEESSPRVSSASEQVNNDSNISKADDKSINSARSGRVFQDVLNETKVSLEQKISQGDENLEKIDDLSDEAASHIRMACGKGKLLIKKKLSKFSELVNKNLNPLDGDLQPATDDDLEGYWALVEIELEDIYQCFNIVDKWRMNNWNEPEIGNENLRNNNNVVKAKPQIIKVKPVPPQMKPKTEKQIAMELQRKKQMAEARAKMIAARKAQKDENDCDVIIAS